MVENPRKSFDSKDLMNLRRALAVLALAAFAARAGAASSRTDEAVRLFDARQFDRARPLLEAALREDPRDARAANYLGACALSLPAGLSRAGLPIGVQLMGAPFADATLARIGQAFQRETSWHVRTPDLHTLMPAKSR